MRIRTRSLVIMLSQSLSQATALVLGIILVRMISQQDFGTFRQVMLVYMFLAGVISLQLPNSLYYFVPKLGAQQQRRLLLQTMGVTGALALVIAVLMLGGAEFVARRFDNPDLAPLVRIMALYPFAERLVLLIPAYMISVDRALRGATYSVVAAVGRVGAVVTMLALGFDLPAVMWAMVAVAGMVALVGCVDVLRICPPGPWKFARDLLKEQLAYTWPLLATAVVGTVNLQLNQLLIAVFFNPEEYAVYSCGAIQLPVVDLITASLAAAMMPRLVTLAGEGRLADALYTWQEGARKASLVIFPCFAFCLVCGHDFIVALFGQDYALASWPFRVYLCALPVRVAVYAAMLRAVGQTKVIAIGAILALVTNVIASTALVLLGRGGLLSFIGPTIGTVLATWASWVYLLRKITRVTDTPLARVMRWKELGIVLLVSAACAAVVAPIPLSGVPLLAQVVIRAIICAVVFLLVLVVARLLSEDEKEMLRWPLVAYRRLCSRRPPAS